MRILEKAKKVIAVELDPRMDKESVGEAGAETLGGAVGGCD